MADSIIGTITGPSGPVPNAEVVASAGGNDFPAVTDQAGKYTIPQLQPGGYTVTVFSPFGFVNPAAQPNVQVQQGQDTQADFQVVPASLSGRVFKKDDKPEPVAQVRGTDDKGNVNNTAVDKRGYYTFTNLAPGSYTVEITAPPDYVPAHNVTVIANVITSGIDFSLNPVEDFLGRLDDTRFSVESPISIEEANQAVSLFSVANVMLAGLGKRKVGNEEKIDALGVLSLYYGLQDGSLQDKVTVANSSDLWSRLEVRLKDLAQELDRVQSDVDFLTKEAKRQFNLGTSNGVLANVQFPTLFKRYVEIGTDPLLSIDLAKQEANQNFDKVKLGQAYDLLKELKGVILQIVRSLSKYGTAATKRVNESWAGYEARSLEVLATVAQYRIHPDQDEKNQWAILSALSNKNRETEVAPYVVLARHGGKLLKYAMEIYLKTQNELDRFDESHLLNLFQTPGQPFWTEKIRAEATVIKRYPLPNWG